MSFTRTNRRAGPDEREWLAFHSGMAGLFQTHQFSYSIPYAFLDDGERSVDGIG